MSRSTNTWSALGASRRATRSRPCGWPSCPRSPPLTNPSEKPRVRPNRKRVWCPGFDTSKEARAEAEVIVKYMIDREIVTPEDPRAEEALTIAIEIARAKTVQPASRLQAARIVLDFTKQKPASKVDATVRKAEDFLSVLASE